MCEGRKIDTGKLLAWYDANARILPWRIPPADSRAGLRPDPYHVWLSEIMLQQTTVAAVQSYFLKFTARWPTIQDLAAAADDQVMAAWAGLGYYARARNLLKCARFLSKNCAGVFPQSSKELLALPGIGPYTAAAIGAIAFGHRTVVVDGNVERVMSRLFAVKTPLPQAKPALHAHASRLTPRARCGDYAQAVMDLGATICTPRSPTCTACPWKSACHAFELGIQNGLPRRSPKPVKPLRNGIVWIARRDDGAFLLERRPDKGLLGGMLGWPGTGWHDNPAEQSPINAKWQVLSEKIRHTFTHFHLQLEIHTTLVPVDTQPRYGAFLTQNEFDAQDLPTVMRKAYLLVASI